MKKNRQERILELIQEENIETQEELADRLSEEGFVVTQATVSRDIRELKLGKIPYGNGKQRYAVLSHDDAQLADKYIRVLRHGFVSMDNAQNILVKDGFGYGNGCCGSYRCDEAEGNRR